MLLFIFNSLRFFFSSEWSQAQALGARAGRRDARQAGRTAHELHAAAEPGGIA